MVPYHGETATSFSLIFWKHIPDGVKSIEDLAKLPSANVSVESGSVPEAYMSQYHPTIPMKSFQGSLAPLIDVKYGKSTANLVQPDVAEYLKQQHPEIEILTIPLPQKENILGFGIGIKKGNQELFDQIQQIIHELKVSGELKQLEDKWFKGNS